MIYEKRCFANGESFQCAGRFQVSTTRGMNIFISRVPLIYIREVLQFSVTITVSVTFNRLNRSNGWIHLYRSKKHYKNTPSLILVATRCRPHSTSCLCFIPFLLLLYRNAQHKVLINLNGWITYARELKLMITRLLFPTIP